MQNKKDTFAYWSTSGIDLFLKTVVKSRKMLLNKNTVANVLIVQYYGLKDQISTGIKVG